MARAKTRDAGNSLQVPQTDRDAEQMIARLGALQVDLAAAQATHDARIAEIEGKHGDAVKQSQAAQDTIVKGLSVWASANRERLTGGKLKTVQLPTGTILWRDGRFSVRHRPLKVDDVIRAVNVRIRDLEVEVARHNAAEIVVDVAAYRAEIESLRSFLRAKVELNKDAMLAERDIANKIPGVVVERGPEEFAVEPLASQIRGDA